VFAGENVEDGVGPYKLAFVDKFLELLFT